MAVCPPSLLASVIYFAFREKGINQKKKIGIGMAGRARPPVQKMPPLSLCSHVGEQPLHAIAYIKDNSFLPKIWPIRHI